MRKRFLILAIHLGLASFILQKSAGLILFYYLLAPLLVLPLFYFYKEAAWNFFGVAIVAAGFTHIKCSMSAPHGSLVLFYLTQVGFFAVLAYYLRDLRDQFDEATARRDEIRDNLGGLQVKYQTRLASLKHLEQQVGSLMNLFEIARDFSECMDFATLTDFLLKKLSSELSFENMRIYVAPKTEYDLKTAKFKVHEMTLQGVAETVRVLTDAEAVDFDVMKTTKALTRRDQTWYFPILEGESVGAVFSIAGVREDDLARVEVLSAYLVLLIKKIKLYETVHELAIIDELTQVFVRHHFTERLEEEIKRSIRFKLPLAVLMLDIDHFKRYNDEFGHLVGDATLKEVADLLKKNLRRVDLVGRYGGEEFVVAMPETKLPNALEIAERIRSNIARQDFQVYGDKTKVTVSQGLEMFEVSELEDPAKGDAAVIASDLVRHADEAMYKAKEEGRNRVCYFKDIAKKRS